MTSTEFVLVPRARSRTELAEEAFAMATRFAAAAVWDTSGRANWFVRKIQYRGETQPGDVPTVQALGPSVYSGTAGVAVFLARAYAAGGDAAHARAAEGAIRTAVDRAFAEDPRWRNGFYLGAVGVAWAAHEVAGRLGRDDLAAGRDEILARLWEDRRKPRLHDVMFGGGGAVPALLRLADEGAAGAEAMATWLADDLVKAADRDGDGASWHGDSPRGPNTPNLTGFSHGASGIGWGLSFAAERTGRADLRDAALGAYAYERRWFDEEEGAWRDLRNFKTPDKPVPRKFATWWCHGSPGIGLARLGAARRLGDPRLDDDLRLARELTRETVVRLVDDPDGDVCVCHGVIGNAEAAWLMGEALGDADASDEAMDVGHALVDRYGARHGIAWPTAVAKGEYPPLLTGAGGAGHFLLRLAFPGRFESTIVPAHPVD